jgi:hypothetical protein
MTSNQLSAARAAAAAAVVERQVSAAENIIKGQVNKRKRSSSAKPVEVLTPRSAQRTKQKKIDLKPRNKISMDHAAEDGSDTKFVEAPLALIAAPRAGAVSGLAYSDSGNTDMVLEEFNRENIPRMEHPCTPLEARRPELFCGVVLTPPVPLNTSSRSVRAGMNSPAPAPAPAARSAESRSQTYFSESVNDVRRGFEFISPPTSALSADAGSSGVGGGARRVALANSPAIPPPWLLQSAATAGRPRNRAVGAATLPSLPPSPLPLPSLPSRQFSATVMTNRAGRGFSFIGPGDSFWRGNDEDVASAQEAGGGGGGSGGNGGGSGGGYGALGSAGTSDNSAAHLIGCVVDDGGVDGGGGSSSGVGVGPQRLGRPRRGAQRTLAPADAEAAARRTAGAAPWARVRAGAAALSAARCAVSSALRHCCTARGGHGMVSAAACGRRIAALLRWAAAAA